MNKLSQKKLFKIFICQRCLAFFSFRSFMIKHGSIYVELKCFCNRNYCFFSLDNLLNRGIYFYDKLAVRNNFFSIMKKNNWKIININTNPQFIQNECNCKQDKIKYCIDCKNLICNSCSSLHSQHKLFYYNHSLYINDKDLHKLENNCYQSYNNLKKCLANVKSYLIILANKNNKLIKVITD